jgi:anaphase-promoting complex subunit 1
VLENTQVPSHAHGGLLLGLGLQGTLAHLSKPDIYDHLQFNHEGMTIGLLLGLAASKLGTEDTNVSKNLRLYLPAVLPTWNLEAEFSTVLQVYDCALFELCVLYPSWGRGGWP